MEALNKDIVLANIYLQTIGGFDAPSIDTLTVESVPKLAQQASARKKTTHVLDQDDDEDVDVEEEQEPKAKERKLANSAPLPISQSSGSSSSSTRSPSIVVKKS